MEEEDRRNDRLQRCFIVAPYGRETEQIAKIFSERGIECLQPDKIVASRVSEEILKHLAASDFVVASLHGSMSPNQAFELGVAYALRKPTLIFSTSYDAVFEDLRGAYFVKTEPNEIREAGHDIDRFLRYAREASTIETHSPRMPSPGNFSWARDRAAALKHERGASRALAFEQLVSDVFRKAGGQVVAAKAGADRGVDLVVWLNDVAFETGGPMLIQCKYYAGGSSRSIASTREAVEKLEKLVTGSDASFALLVFSHDRPNSPANMVDTPHVLGFEVEQLIDAIEKGTFTAEVLARRRRAASALGMTVASD